jgi:hypothetical protein
MASTIRGNDNFDTAGGNAVKAWVNFNGTGTVAIRASYNVSSITDGGVGLYTVNFTTAMPDANYAPKVSASALSDINAGTVATGSCGFRTYNDTGAYVDASTVSISIFR